MYAMKNDDLTKRVTAGIGEFLTERLKEMCLSQREAGKKCGIPQKTMNRYCNGTKILDVVDAVKLSMGLGISVNDMILRPCFYEKDWNKVFEAFKKRFAEDHYYLDNHANWRIYSENPQQIMVFTNANGTVIYDFWEDKYWFA